MDVSNRQVAEAFVELAEFTPSTHPERLSARCVELLGAQAAGVLLTDPADGSAPTLDSRAVQVDEGAGVDCLTTGLPVRCHDLATARTRWPRFAPAAHEAGFRSVYAFPMRRGGQAIGALEVFAAHAVGLGDEDIALGQALADVTAVGIVHERDTRSAGALVEQLQDALDSRVAIEQAKGILAERYEIDVDTAFTALRGYARSHRRRLLDVAKAVVAMPAGSTTCSR